MEFKEDGRPWFRSEARRQEEAAEMAPGPADTDIPSERPVHSVRRGPGDLAGSWGFLMNSLLEKLKSEDGRDGQVRKGGCGLDLRNNTCPETPGYLDSGGIKKPPRNSLPSSTATASCARLLPY